MVVAKPVALLNPSSNELIPGKSINPARLVFPCIIIVDKIFGLNANQGTCRDGKQSKAKLHLFRTQGD